MNQLQLSDLTGISQAAISRLENGHGGVSDEAIAHVSAILGFPVKTDLSGKKGAEK